MFEGQGTHRRVLDAVEAWIPTKAHGHESKFQNELKEYLDETLNNSSGGSLLDLDLDMGGAGEYSVRRERGAARADLVVNDTVGIEMKRDLTNSQIKTLRGQLESYLDNYNFVIICACGIKDMGGWRELKQKYQGKSGPIGTIPKTVDFVHKKKDNYGKEPRGNSGGLLDGWL